MDPHTIEINIKNQISYIACFLFILFYLKCNMTMNSRKWVFMEKKIYVNFTCWLHNNYANIDIAYFKVKSFVCIFIQFHPSYIQLYVFHFVFFFAKLFTSPLTSFNNDNFIEFSEVMTPKVTLLSYCS